MILLLVVSLLALFVLLGATFSLIALHALTASKMELKNQQRGDQPETEMDLVLGQILYDTQARTALWGQSLLADVYGIDGIAGVVSDNNATSTNPSANPSATPPQFGQFLRFNAAVSPVPADHPHPQPFITDPPVFSSVPDYYTGRVLTFRDGPLSGFSARITRYEPPASGIAAFYTEMPKRDATSAAYPLAGNRFVINGAPFNGTGLGYGNSGGSYRLNEPSPFSLNVTGSEPEYMALLPHLAGYNSTSLPTIFNAAIKGGMDESYDAADYQNMYLAMVPPGRTKNSNLPILPSFHRPELVAYWLNKIDPAQKDGISGLPYIYNTSYQPLRDFFRQFIFRPMPWDHPNFTGSNPNFPSGVTNLPQLMNSLQGKDAAGNPFASWDVDNDNDTIPDSIWIDPGLPIITMPDGRRVKRLAAILIKDLDGRINVNVHGNSQQWYEDANILTGTKDVHRTAFPVPPGPWKPGSATTNIYPSRGFGIGPAEVDFQHIFGTVGNPKLAYQRLITARYVRGTENNPGLNSNDYYTAFRWMGVPDFHSSLPGTTQQSRVVLAKEWASPPDVWGRGAMALDQFGQPYWFFSSEYYYDQTRAVNTGDNNDNPYEVQYDYARAPADSPYLPREMERLLRYHDPDSPSLQSRLIDTTLGFLGELYTAGERPGELSGDSHFRRELLTVMGSHIPVPPGIVTTELRNTLGTGPVTASKTVPGPGYNSILDLYYRILQSTGTGFPQAWARIVPFEFRHGELFNINRPFGNGVDDNNNGIADEPLENGLANQPIFLGGPTMEKANDSPFGVSADPRLDYARHLYCLMMLLKDNSSPTPWQVQADLDGSGGAPNADDTARLIAQWAINVVDFRDSDCIMTRFDYDPQPFNADGWSPTGSTFVWGVERPELLLSETLAFHDRRTEDLATEAPEPPGDPRATTTEPMNPDLDYDQRHMPQATCFIELYNPWHDASNGTLQRRPAELYTTQNNVTGIDLDRTAGGVAGGAPVWRMLVVKGDTHDLFQVPGFNPDAVRLNAALAANASDVERAVYFTDPGAVLLQDPLMAACVPFYSSRGATTSGPSTLSLLTPGQYAVVGSAGSLVGGNYVTYVGRADGDDSTMPQAAQTRQIVLIPGQQRTAGNTTQAEIVMRSNGTTGANDIPALAQRAPIAVPIDLPRSFNITDPLSGYPPVVPPVAPIVDGDYQPVRDEPLDRPVTMTTGVWDPQVDGTFGSFKTLLLQRLADPTQAFDPSTNPYITIDRSSLDVTTFNGITRDRSPQNQAGAKAINFQSFQRGGSHPQANASGNWDLVPGGIDAERKLWPFTPARDMVNVIVTDSLPETNAVPHYFARRLYHTLGYLNSRYGQPITTGPYSGAPSSAAGLSAAFPWLAFNNRPFANAMELLQVPATNQYGLLANFRIKSAAAIGNEYETNLNVPFGHLLNFFQARETTPPMPGPHFSRLFDFVHVPSPFVQADMYYNHQHFNTNYTTNTDTPSNVPALNFRPPFHRMSRFRDPGRVNINTVFDDATSTATNVPTNPILQALFKGTPSMDPGMQQITATDTRGATFVKALRLSRQGYAGSGEYTVDSSSNQPSMFANAFRAQDASDLVPGGQALPPVTAGLLRPQSQPVTPTAVLQPALFSYELPLTATTGYEHEDPNRNPYFRYQQFQRVGNLLSTQSNCFAVWITIGYFEVEENRSTVAPFPIVFDAGHLDGYSLGQEVGIDSGEVTRHRGFYLIDRSIPVGFMPGSRLNTDDCVLVRRLIE